MEGFAGVNVEPWDLSDGQWSYITQNSGYNEFRNMEEVEAWIYHRRGDNSVHKWFYTNQDRSDDQADDTGEIGGRELHNEEEAE